MSRTSKCSSSGRPVHAVLWYFLHVSTAVRQIAACFWYSSLSWLPERESDIDTGLTHWYRVPNCCHEPPLIRMICFVAFFLVTWPRFVVSCDDLSGVLTLIFANLTYTPIRWSVIFIKQISAAADGRSCVLQIRFLTNWRHLRILLTSSTCTREGNPLSLGASAVGGLVMSVHMKHGDSHHTCCVKPLIWCN
jgi:hypothetical protein